MRWAYYDAAGKRVPPQHAAFKGREVQVDSRVPAPAGHASLAATEYHDVQPIDRPDLARTFKSAAKMRAWLRECGAQMPPPAATN
jgi:hypothetical protein